MSRTTPAVRVLLVAAAAAAVVWLALGYGASRDEARGTALASKPGRLADSVSALRNARAHNHDTAPLVLEAQAEIFAKHPGRAIPLLDTVVRREPANVQAWGLLADAADHADPVRAAAARARVLALSPPVG
jgi:predicted Zn-dependent protease